METTQRQGGREGGRETLLETTGMNQPLVSIHKQHIANCKKKGDGGFETLIDGYTFQHDASYVISPRSLAVGRLSLIASSYAANRSINHSYLGVNQ